MRKIKKGYKIVLVVFVLLLSTYLCLPRFAQRALVHTTAGIEDYEIFENRTIQAGDPQLWEVDEVASKLELNDEILLEFERLETVAYLVLKDGKIIYEHYWDDYGTESLSNSFSMAKSVVSLLVGAAIDDGYIESVEEPIAEYIAEYNSPTNEHLKIKDVLTMSSGLNWDESYGSLFSKTTEAYYGTNIRKLIYDLEVVEEPGVKYKYLSGNTQLLAMVVEAATGKNISEYTSEKFWKPMGAENDALWCLDSKDGMEKAYCCFNSNARDFARWGQLVLNKGKWNGETLISEEYIARATQAASYLKDNEGTPVRFYGYQWWVHHINDWEVPYMRGILGQYVFAIPEENAVVVRLGHKREKMQTNYHPNDSYLYLNAAKELFEKYKEL